MLLPRRLFTSTVLALAPLAVACGGAGSAEETSAPVVGAGSGVDAGSSAPSPAVDKGGEAQDGAASGDSGTSAPPSTVGTTTTLTAETSNNTSASSAFTTRPDGDITPQNVSKVSLKKLLPSGYTGQVLAHWMPWWSCSTTPCDGIHTTEDDMRVHYSTEDPTQVDKIIEDMISRGYDGVMVAEYNTGDVNTASTKVMAKETAKYPGFSFSISENHLDKIKATKTQSAATLQLAQLLGDMKEVNTEYFGMPNYLKIGGQPVVYVFDNGSVDWEAAAKSATGSPLFILDGPSKATTSLGGFYWFGGLSKNDMLTSADAITGLDSLYQTVADNPGRLYSGSFFKGFDDTEAAWSLNRKVDQACGLTFVRSLAAVGTYLAKSPSSLPLLQVATWDDYEEGTEVETGIDNCAAVSATVSGSVITPLPAFTGVGSEETVDHYTVYLSTDGENLIDAGDVSPGGSAGEGSIDASTLGLPAGAYKAFVKMVGKSHIVNHMSPPVSLTL